jgi:hypothetical protein
MRAVERAFRTGDVGRENHVAQVLERDAVIGKTREVRLNADRRPDVALHRHAAYAGQLAQPLREQGIGDVAERAQRDCVRGNR